MIDLPLWMVAKKVDNYEIDATGASTRWPDDKTYKNVVPTGRRWFILGGAVNRDVSSTFSVRLYNSADKIIMQMDSQAASTGVTAWPASLGAVGVATAKQFWIADEDEYVQMTFGTSQTAGAYATCVVLEVMHEP